MSQSNRRRVIARAVVSRIEPLELRRLLCGTPHGAAMTEHSETEVGGYRPTVYMPEHITRSDYLKLSPAEQALINPHMIEDDRSEAEQLAPIQAALAGRVLGEAGADALPDMVPLVGGGYLEPYVDKTEQPGRNLLRFSTAVGNMGDGPIILSSSNSDINPDGTQNVTQTIYTRTGNTLVANRTRNAAKFVWHSGHGHFHYEGYADYRLLTNVNGQPGPIAMRADGTPAVGDKVGFCLINITSSFTIPGTNTSTTTLPNYGLSGQPATGCGFLQGIHVGNADVYDSVYDGQWIDVTGIPNGSYFLEVTIDGSNTVLEKNEANNTVYVPYTLNTTNATGGIAADRFESPTPNNTFAAATNLGEMGNQSQAGLTIHTNYDEDFFRFTAASSGNGTITTRATHGDVNVFLYDANGVLLKSSTTSGSGSSANPQTDAVTHSFVKGQTYYVRTDGLGSGTTSTSGRSNNYTIQFAIKPTAGVVDAKVKVGEGGTASIVFTRNGPTSSPLTLNLTVTGTATSGVDYFALPSSITIGNEASTYELPVFVKTDAVAENVETVVITVQANSAYVLGATTTTLLIEDRPSPLNGVRPVQGGRPGMAGRAMVVPGKPAATAAVAPSTATERATSFLRNAAGQVSFEAPALFSTRPVTALLETV